MKYGSCGYPSGQFRGFYLREIDPSDPMRNPTMRYVDSVDDALVYLHHTNTGLIPDEIDRSMTCNHRKIALCKWYYNPEDRPSRMGS